MHSWVDLKQGLTTFTLIFLLHYIPRVQKIKICEVII